MGEAFSTIAAAEGTSNAGWICLPPLLPHLTPPSTAASLALGLLGPRPAMGGAGPSAVYPLDKKATVVDLQTNLGYGGRQVGPWDS